MLPRAERFSDREGEPPVFRAYGADPATGREALLGYAFLTSDLPPEEMGYNAPIQVLVGMDLAGTLTGARVVDYRESLRSSRGDFLRSGRFQEQFAGKGVVDPFRVRLDIDGISGATISVAAMARAIRNSARRVAMAYLTGARLAVPEPLHPGTATAETLTGLSWLDMMDGGLVQWKMLLDDDRSAIEVFYLYLRDASVGALLMGEDVYRQALEWAGERAEQEHVFLVGVDGPYAVLHRATATYLVQGSDTVRMAQGDLHMLGPPRSGKVDGQFQNVGILLVDSAAVDIQQPFTLVLDLRPGLSFATTEFPGLAPPLPPPPPRAVAAEAAGTGAAADAEGGGPVGEGVPPRGSDGGQGTETDSAGQAERAPGTPPGSEAGSPAAASSGPETGAAAPASAGSADALETALARSLQDAGLPFVFDDDEEETLLARTLATTSWGRVTGLLLLLALASVAFAAKLPGLRWAALAATLVFLGFVDGGFLSVSHITSAILVGPSVYLSDLPLLILVTFTVVTTLLWGRVFCGFLCPFGALQDFLEKVVPERLRRELPRRLHERALWIKYGVLVLVLAPAALGTGLSLFQYFEPFGTVFFFSTSLVLWSVAGGLLVASAVVPRFYCRYVCPLGASLAVVSVVSPLRIRRVEHCDVCKVCEQHCPTGAIRGPDIDFKECVRCNVCETLLIEKAGVCRHDMEQVRPRLIQIATSVAGAVGGGR